MQFDNKWLINSAWHIGFGNSKMQIKAENRVEESSKINMKVFTVVLNAIAAVIMAAELERTSLIWSSAKASNMSLFNLMFTNLQYRNNPNFNKVPTINMTYNVRPTSNGGKLPLNPPMISTNENCITSIDANDIINAQTITDNASNRDRPKEERENYNWKSENWNTSHERQQGEENQDWEIWHSRKNKKTYKIVDRNMKLK